MAQYLQGVSPTQTDTVAQFTLGTESRDPRSRDFPNNIIRYVKAGSAITLGDALIASTSDADEPNTLTPSSAIQQSVVGIAHVGIASGSFGWVTTKGRVASASAAASTAAGARLGSSASGGKLQTLTQADSNFTSNDYFELLAYAMSPIIALDANDSNGANIEVFLGQG